MSKYVNADELTKIIKTHHYMLATALNSRDYGMFTTGIEQAISETESVEVIRCKDCRYYKNYYDNYKAYYNFSFTEEDMHNGECRYIGKRTGVFIEVNENSFCSKGERKNTE